MKREVLATSLCLLFVSSIVSADTFGTGGNQFTIDFVTISDSTNPAGGYGIVNNDYRIGIYEITMPQFDEYLNSLSPVPPPQFNQPKVPAAVNWYMAARFVNWLNTITGHQEAYNFTETGFSTWNTAEAAGGTNLYRHKNAMYCLPTEDEWVKAAYWNGTNLQTHATKAGENLTQGDGTSGTGWRYYSVNGLHPSGPWVVGKGSEELNGTYDMMGNVWEWMESPYSDLTYAADSSRSVRGGSFSLSTNAVLEMSSSYHTQQYPNYMSSNLGFRVASVPEPGTILLLGLGAMMLRKNHR
jgi:formylglycine-generating enzyme required for sulfatase activity